MQMTSGSEPRYKYAKPTEKAQHGKPWEHAKGVGTESSSYMADYKLPVKKVEDMKNFIPYQKETFWTQEELVGINSKMDGPGTTDTDSDASKDLGVVASNKKSGSKSRWNTKRS